MIRSCWELHFGEQCNGKKGCGFKELMPWYDRGGIDARPVTRWRRPCMRVAVCLSIDQGELLGGYSGVEAGGRKGRGATTSPVGLSYPKSKVLDRKEADSEERHSVAEADLLIAKEGMQMQGNG
ncbi:hypothetical protein B296_00036119 [Ensete ventricosum]|uniref:Uncharacterized protein n=1 Tax=Ensete ventricosum TaxID=4639 RepID=A0A426YLU0_ENSVE|nr:hypothetical protein B296_00036119 [Ensete ventricosum]